MNLQWLDDCKTTWQWWHLWFLCCKKGVRNSEELSPTSHKETIGFAEKEELCINRYYVIRGCHILGSNFLVTFCRVNACLDVESCSKDRTFQIYLDISNLSDSWRSWRMYSWIVPDTVWSHEFEIHPSAISRREYSTMIPTRGSLWVHPIEIPAISGNACLEKVYFKSREL